MVTVTILGGAGRMGQWFAKFLKANGYKIIISDSNRRSAKTFCKIHDIDIMDDWLAAVRLADIVLLATPTNHTSLLLRQLLPVINKKTLIIEISSVKAPIQDVMSEIREKNMHVLSLHPMFGPGTHQLRGRTILIMTRPRHPEAKRLLSILRERGAKITTCSIERHDLLVSIVISLPHLMNICMIETLRKLRVDFSELIAISGPTFKLQALLAEAIYHEDTANEISILADSKSSILRAYAQRVRTILNLIDRNPDRLIAVLNKGRRLVQTDNKYAESYQKFNAAVEVARG